MPLSTDIEGAALPAWVSEIRPHQQDAVDEAIEHYQAGVKAVFIDGPTGCLHGDTVLILNRAGKGFRMPIRDVVHRINGGAIPVGRGHTRTTKWDPNIVTEVAYSDGTHIRKMVVDRAFSSGVKECWKLTTECGMSITASAEHPLFEREGGWTELLHLEAGVDVAIRDPKRGRNASPKRRDKFLCGLVQHPRAHCRGTADVWSGWRVWVHQLVLEAQQSGVSFDEFVERCRRGPVDGLWFVPVGWEVHHIDGDHTNNDPVNLVALTAAEHHQVHTDERTVLFRQGWATVESIEPVGEHETFDLTMIDAPHSYVANGFVVHNSGKTLIGELIRRRLPDIDPQLTRRGLYVCTDKQLQDQFVKDFPYAKVLKGRANYPTLNGDDNVTADDCSSSGGESPCMWCEPKADCPYQVAKREAVEAELAVLNTSYLLAEANTGMPSFSRQPFIIADEADELEGSLLGVIEFEVPMWAGRELRLQYPKKGVHKPTILKWLVELEDTAREHVRTRGYAMDAKTKRRWRQLIERVVTMQAELAKDDNESDEDGRWLRDYDTKTLKLVPVLVGRYGPKKLWRHGHRWLLMSATLISPDQMAEELGLPWEFETVTVPMTFPVENRPIYLAPIANMTYAADDHEYEKLADAIAHVLDRHPQDRVLVHTVSYKLNARLVSMVRHRVEGRAFVTYESARDKQNALAQYRRQAAAVLFAPSASRGVDLKGDDCRVVVIVKAPYPSFGDKRVAARTRLPGGDMWYMVQTIRDIVQMTGRGVRSADDYATTYILDKQFMTNVWRRGKPLFPRWWRDAVDPSFNPRHLMGPR